MNLNYVKIGKKGEDEEYILFKASNDCYLKNYLVHDNTFDADGDLSNKLRHMYRFNRNLTIKAGEYVALYVKKKGEYKIGTYDNAVCHLFYWGLDVSVFNADGDHLYLLKIDETKRFPV